jgi:transposase
VIQVGPLSVAMEVMTTSISFSELLAILIPDASTLRVDTVEVDPSIATMTLTVTSTQSTPVCPACQQAASRAHSRYTRHLADLPWGELPVRLQLQVRKFFCDQPTCPRRIFTERLPTVVAPWARRTTRLAHHQRHIGLALGGSAGARLAAQLAQPASRTTFLHLIRTTPQLEQPTPRVLGIDDWVRPVPSKQAAA